MKNFKKSIASAVCLLSILAVSPHGFAAPEKAPQTEAKASGNDFMDPANLAKKYYDMVVEKECLTKEEVQNEIERVKLNMTLEFTKYLSEYVKSNPKRKLKHIDMRGLFSDFLTFNVKYTNRGDTNFTPLAVKGVAKGTLAGGAAMTK